MKNLCLCLELVGLFFTFGGTGTAHAADGKAKTVKHVVIMGFDGFASSSLDWSRMPNFNRLRKEGRWTLHSRSCIPSSSAINWATLMMGAPSEMHGFRRWNSQKPDLKPITVTSKGLFPCIFSVVRDQMPKAYTVAAWNWGGIKYILQTRDLSAYKGFPDAQAHEQARVDWFLDQMKNRPTLSFLYSGEPDWTGHRYGWKSSKYMDQVVRQDRSLGEVIAYLEKNDWMKDTVVIVISDHGGKNKGHGGESMDEMESPFIMWGAGIKPGEIKSTMMGFDVAPTIAELLGLKVPDAWRGRSVLNR